MEDPKPISGPSSPIDQPAAPTTPATDESASQELLDASKVLPIRHLTPPPPPLGFKLSDVISASGQAAGLTAATIRRAINSN